jgi:hypothetical protein
MSTPYYYGPEDIYNLAAENGIVPSSYQSPPPEVPRGVEDSSALGGPGPQLTPPTPPLSLFGSETAADAMGTPGTDISAKVGTKEGYGLSQSSRAFNPAGYTAIGDKTDRELAARQAQSEAGVNEVLGQDVTNYESAYGEKTEAQKNETQAQINAVGQEGKDALYMKGVIDKSITDTRKIAADGEAKINTAKAMYMKNLSEWGAMKVDPNQFWHNLNGGQKFIMLTTAFMHDFLGAKGINTSAMDSMKAGMDRNMKAQIDNIQHGKDVTEGFKALYDNEIKHSQSRVELEERLRPYYLESAKQQVIANMAPIKSALASAQGQSAIAELDKAKADALAKVHEHIVANVTARQHQDMTYVMDKAKVAAENYATSVRANSEKLAQERFKLEQKRLDAKEAKEAMGNLVIDPEDRKAKRMFLPNMSDADKSKVRDAVAGTYETNQQIERLKGLARKIGGGTIMGAIKPGSAMNTEIQREYMAITTNLAHAMAHANGERASDKDVADFRQNFPLETALTNGGIDNIVSWTQQTALNKAKSTVESYSTPLKPEEQIQFGEENMMPKARAIANADFEESERGGYKTTDTDKAMEVINGPKSAGKANKKDFEATGENKDDVEAEWRDWASKNDVGKKWAYYGQGAGKPGTMQVDKSASKPEGEPKDLPSYAVGIVSLASKAEKGDKTAYAQLVKIATTNPRTEPETDSNEDMDEHDKLIEYYWAQYELSKIKGGVTAIKQTEAKKERQFQSQTPLPRSVRKFTNPSNFRFEE